MRVVPPSTFSELYAGPGDFFVSGRNEMIIKDGSDTAKQWAA